MKPLNYLTAHVISEIFGVVVMICFICKYWNYYISAFIFKYMSDNACLCAQVNTMAG